MGEARAPAAVKLILGAFTVHQELFEQAYRKLSKHWGEIDLTSAVFPFDHTEYYQAEMGHGLLRQFVSFEKLLSPQNLVDCKVLSNQIEESFADDKGNRLINLDPGYLTPAKLILASTKDFSHRIYLNDGIYAEVTLQYSKSMGGWLDLPWTYPDYRVAETKEFFMLVRRHYRQQLVNPHIS